MKSLLTIMKEIGISVIIIIIVSAAAIFAFRDKLPLKLDIPKAQEYDSIDYDNYKVVGDIQDAIKITIPYEATPSELEMYQTELRYIPGSVNPFVAEEVDTNLPSETVSVPVGGLPEQEQISLEQVSGKETVADPNSAAQ